MENEYAEIMETDSCGLVSAGFGFLVARLIR